eukprot:723314_1
MGSSDSSCCGAHSGPVKFDPFNSNNIRTTGRTNSNQSTEFSILNAENAVKINNVDEECNEAPVKQNKKQDSPDDINDTYNQFNTQNVNNNNENLPDNPAYFLTKTTSHIDYLLDKDAAEKNDAESEYDSISDLSDDFNEEGGTMDFQKKTKSKSHKKILRYKSKANWDTVALDQHENDMMAQIR